MASTSSTNAIAFDAGASGAFAAEDCAGDDLGTVYTRYSSYVAAISFRLLGRDHEIDDIVQEVFLAAHRGLENLRDPMAIKGWLATVTVRAVRRKLRFRRLRACFGLDPGTDYTTLTIDANQDKALLITRAYQVLDQLPVDQKIAWILRHAEGESLESVAERCGCSLATAKRRIAAAQAALAEVAS
jgi:RNA polymerase sigma-70 factor, ECF subfamily